MSRDRHAEEDTPEDRMRLDVFLCARARFFKARTSATEAIEIADAPASSATGRSAASTSLPPCRASGTSSASLGAPPENRPVRTLSSSRQKRAAIRRRYAMRRVQAGTWSEGGARVSAGSGTAPDPGPVENLFAGLEETPGFKRE